MASSTVSAKCEALFIRTKQFGVLPDQISAFFRVVMRCGEDMFWGQPVLNRNDPTVTVKRQLAELIIMSIKTPANKAATVVVDHRG
ncbi:hypothetical protein D3C78_1409690 [compost metagenome]